MKQFRRFFVLGFFSTIIDFLIYSLLIFLNFNYVVAIIFGYGSGFLFNFFIGRKHVFQNGTKANSFLKEFNFVLLINIFAVLLNIFIVYLLYSYMNVLNQIYARIVAIIVVFLWNYYARKIFVYH